VIAASHPAERLDPAQIEGVAGQSPARDAAIAHDSTGIAPSVTGPCHATAVTQTAVVSQRKRAARATLTARQRNAARLDAEGATVDAITTTVPTTRSALARWRRLAPYIEAVAHMRTAIRTTTDAELETARLVSARALRGLLDASAGLTASELAKVASTLLSASTPPGEQARRLAAKEARTAWTAALAPEAPDVRARVLARVDGSYDDLPTEELERRAGERE
jgi:hypothetical protein